MRKCAIKGCAIRFTPRSITHKACGPEHAALIAADKREREERAQFKARKEAAKPLRERLKDTEKVINKYVRVRDAHLGCISCDKPASWDGQWHASHFKSVGSNSVLRFHLWNIHKACSECNLFMSGNIEEYRKRLILKKGQAVVDWLERQNGVRKYDPEYLDRLKKVIAKRTKRLERRLGGLNAHA